jgi:molecular chaperone GrpE
MPNSRASEEHATSGAPDVATTEQQHNGEQQMPEREAELRAELAQMEDRYKRALADLDNYRKRSARDVEWRISQVTESLLRDWFESIDSVERALRMAPAGDPLHTGMRSVLDQMEAILARQGVQRIGAPGEPFDAERHEAVDVRASDELPDRAVIDVARSGFARGDRVLRPAQVVVARRPEGSA